MLVWDEALLPRGQTMSTSGRPSVRAGIFHDTHTDPQHQFLLAQKGTVTQLCQERRLVVHPLGHLEQFQCSPKCSVVITARYIHPTAKLGPWATQ